MSTPVLVGLYQPGDSVIHRLPVGVKVAGLALFSVTVVTVRDAAVAVCLLTVAGVCAAVARVRFGTVLRQTRAVLVVAVVVGAFQWWLSGPAKAVESLFDLLALALMAVVVTASTPVNAMLDAVVRWLGPVPFVDADRVALVLALAVRALPGTIELATETRDAAAARGLGRHPRAFLAPFVVRVVARAQHTGDALAARGIGDD